MTKTTEDAGGETEQEQLRAWRKNEHLAAARRINDGPGGSWLDCVHFVHNCFSGTDPAAVDLSTRVAGIDLKVPLLINALTGGTPGGRRVNHLLAEAAVHLGTGIAVGSQRAAIDDPAVRDTFSIVRDVVRDGVVLANISLDVTPLGAKQAVEMVAADGLQVHLNVAQELAMTEGECGFAGAGIRLKSIVDAVDVPVIAKETGCGIAMDQALSLAGLGVKAVDVGGRGGTNFLAIEASRRDTRHPVPLDWGIPTAASLVECGHALAGSSVSVVGTGGIRSGLDLARVLALGADAGGMAGPLVRVLAQADVDELIAYCREMLSELAAVMVMVGARSISELKRVPLVLMPPLKDWLELRGIDPGQYARRG